MNLVTVIYDANVFYPAPLRDLLLRLADTGLFRARWSQQIEDEWVRNLLENRPELAERLPKTLELIHAHFHDHLIDDYQHWIPSIVLPDLQDRHVVAAAIAARASYIITFNLRDFPAQSLRAYRLTAIHPDDFIAELFQHNPAIVLSAVAEQRRALKNPPYSQQQLLEAFRKQGLLQTSALLAPYLSAF